jgi:hypothetical protein
MITAREARFVFGTVLLCSGINQIILGAPWYGTGLFLIGSLVFPKGERS